MKKVNNFRIAEVHPQGVAYLEFLPNFSMELLIKVLSIKKACKPLSVSSPNAGKYGPE